MLHKSHLYVILTLNRRDGENKMEIGQKIKALREEKGMTLEELGNKVGVGKSTVRKWETGMIANMRRDKIAKIAAALDTDPAYLMGWENKFEAHYFEKSAAQTINNLIDALPDNIASHTHDYYELSLHNQMLVNKYTKNLLVNQHMEEELTVQAAHERTDIEVTDEMRQHDDDIMDDENF